MKKKILYGQDAQDKIVLGIKKLFKTVAPTFGGEGKNVIFGQQFGIPETTRDGVTVAKEFDLDDIHEKLAADLLRVASLKTNDDVGDGTTTAIILAYHLIKLGFIELKDSKYSPIKLSKDLKIAVNDIIEQLKKRAKKITTEEQMVQIGTIAARDSDIGELVAKTLSEAGKYGVIDVQDSKSTETTKEVVKGLKIDKGYISPYFVNNFDKMTAEYYDMNVLITDHKLSDIDDIIKLLENLKKPLLIMADEVDEKGTALPTLLLNRIKHGARIVVTKAPSFGENRKEILKDIAAITGATLISEDTGLKLIDATEDMLGVAEKITVGKSETIVVGGMGKKGVIDKRINQVKTESGLAEGKYDQENLQKRLAGLTGGIAVIKVGGSSEVEQKEKKYRVEDAVAAIGAALQEGVIPGGGIPLLEISEKLNSKTSINKVLKETLKEPFLQIIRNAGIAPEPILEEIKKKKFKIGYDVVNNKYGDMLEIGIIDPVKVTRTALENAASVAASVLITETIIATEKEEAPPVMTPPQPPMM